MTNYEWVVIDGFTVGEHPDEADGFMIYDNEEEAHHAALSYGGILWRREVGEWEQVQE